MLSPFTSLALFYGLSVLFDGDSWQCLVLRGNTNSALRVAFGSALGTKGPPLKILRPYRLSQQVPLLCDSEYLNLRFRFR